MENYEIWDHYGERRTEASNMEGTDAAEVRKNDAGPLSWQNDHPTFKGAKGKVRDAVRKAAHKDARNEVALYIGKAFVAH